MNAHSRKVVYIAVIEGGFLWPSGYFTFNSDEKESRVETSHNTIVIKYLPVMWIQVNASIHL